MTRADGFLKVKFLDDDTLEYSITIEPIPVEGNVQVFLHFDHMPPITFPARIVK